MAQVAPAIVHDKTSFRIEWADGEHYEGHMDISRAMASPPPRSPFTSTAPSNSQRAGGARAT